MDLLKKLFRLKGNHKVIPEWKGSKVSVDEDAVNLEK
jgi:hypothetical protein